MKDGAQRAHAALSGWWARRLLATRFLIMSAIVIGAGMTVLESWVSAQIKEGVIQNTAADAVPYMYGYVRPLILELETQPELSARSRALLGNLLQDTPLGQRLKKINIWGRDGAIIYSTDQSLSGKKFPISSELRAAWNGEVATEYSGIAEGSGEVASRVEKPLLEIYVPIRGRENDHIIAVGEFYLRAGELARDLFLVRLKTAAVVGGATFVMIGSLLGIVLNGSRLIAIQQQALSDRASELTRLLEHSRELRRRISEATRRSAETSDLFLRRIGAELHDGPAQLIAFGLLKLDALKPREDADTSGAMLAVHAAVRSALREALDEIRGLSAGLALPELDGLSVAEAIELAVRNHERRTRTRVAISLQNGLPGRAPLPLLTCIYRFTQECLNNAYRHAGGKGQSVRACGNGAQIEITVADKGSGIEGGAKAFDRGRLGLIGLRDRVESLGGVFEMGSAPGSGTQVTARINI